MSVATSTTAPPRSTCPRCLRAQSACICAHVQALQPQVDVLILQHPLEVQQSKGSARLLHLSLAGSSLQVGECFDVAQLQQWLHAPGKTSVLLYPATVHDAEGKLLPAAPALPVALPPSQLRLIVLDGTWRKSRKMLYCNPLLQTLPRLSLQAMPPSHYRLRKAHRPDQLSTLEAVCYALMQLEQDEAKYAPLLDAFDGFIAQLARHWGEPQ